MAHRGRFRCVLLIRYSRKWYNRQIHRRYNRYSYMYIYTYVHGAEGRARARARGNDIRGRIMLPGYRYPECNGEIEHEVSPMTPDRREIQSRKKESVRIGRGLGAGKETAG